jgi:serine O-acetyltransferase
MTLHERIRKILFRQLENFWDEWDEEVINRQIPEALEQMNKNYSMAASKQRYRDGNMVFDPMYTGTWAIFLYKLSRLLFLEGNNKEAECIYYLNKVLHSVDWFYQTELPLHFMAEHLLGSVLGRAQYSDYLFVYQGTTIGGNRKGDVLYYPKVGENVVLYANATVLGNTSIGNNVIISANTYIINENIPNNCIVFGHSPNIIIKEQSEMKIKELTEHIWAWKRLLQ